MNLNESKWWIPNFFIKCRLLAVQLLVVKLNWIFFAIEWFVCLFYWLDGCHYGSKNECNRTNMNCLFIFINNFFFFFQGNPVLEKRNRPTSCCTIWRHYHKKEVRAAASNRRYSAPVPSLKYVPILTKKGKKKNINNNNKANLN